jgi:hypothetical protein
VEDCLKRAKGAETRTPDETSTAHEADDVQAITRRQEISAKFSNQTEFRAKPGDVK